MQDYTAQSQSKLGMLDANKNVADAGEVTLENQALKEKSLGIVNELKRNKAK